MRPRDQMKQTTFRGRPHRWPIKLYNTVALTAGRLGLSSSAVNAESILEKARKQTGLTDFGDGEIEQPLGILADAFEKEASLHAFGRQGVSKFLTRVLATRLQIVETLKQQPEILDLEIRKPLFIIGFPRTGTTLLYNLLALDPKARPLLTWEAEHPVPPPRPETRETDPRIRRLEWRLRALKYLVPEFDRVHALSANGPEECHPLLQRTLAAWSFTLLGNIPSYGEWLRKLDHTSSVQAYRFYRNQLQLLQLYCGGEHWVLKSPAHLPFLKALLEVFPGACIVQTHREPREALASTCSLVAVAQRLLNDPIAPEAIGKRVLEDAWRALNRLVELRRSIPARHVVDIQYNELLQNPNATVEKIYDYFDYPMSSEMAAGMRKWLAANPQHKHGRHRYSLAQFGIAPEEVKELFEQYRERFLAIQVDRL